MNPRSQKWFQDALAAGMDKITAYCGTEVIDSWEDFWKHPFSEDNLQKMKAFGLNYPECALHRWSIILGPCPYVPDAEEEKRFKDDPRWSALEDIRKQRNR